MLNVIPFYIFNDSFCSLLLSEHLLVNQTVVSQSSVHPFLKKTKLCSSSMYCCTNSSDGGHCAAFASNTIVWKMVKPSQFRFWVESRYSLMFSASKCHTIPSLVLEGQMMCPPSLWECFPTGFFPVFVWKLQRALNFPLGIWKYQAFSIPKAPNFSVQQTFISRRSLYFSTYAFLRDSHLSL